MVNSTNWGKPAKTSTDFSKSTGGSASFSPDSRESTDWLGETEVLLATEAGELILSEDTTEIILDGVEDTTGTSTDFTKPSGNTTNWEKVTINP